MIRSGELVVQCAGGKCVVCKGRIAPGPAVQLSCKTCDIRHEECLPQEGTQLKIGPYNGSPPRKTPPVKGPDY